MIEYRFTVMSSHDSCAVLVAARVRTLLQVAGLIDRDDASCRAHRSRVTRLLAGYLRGHDAGWCAEAETLAAELAAMGDAGNRAVELARDPSAPPVSPADADAAHQQATMLAAMAAYVRAVDALAAATADDRPAARAARDAAALAAAYQLDQLVGAWVAEAWVAEASL